MREAVQVINELPGLKYRLYAGEARLNLTGQEPDRDQRGTRFSNAEAAGGNQPRQQEEGQHQEKGWAEAASRTKPRAMPEMLCKITKVVGVQGVEALTEVAPEAESPHFLGFIPARLYPGQVAPQSHRLRLSSQKIGLQLALPPARQQYWHRPDQEQRQQCGVHPHDCNQQSSACGGCPGRRHQAVGDLVRTGRRIGFNAVQAIVEPR